MRKENLRTVTYTIKRDEDRKFDTQTFCSRSVAQDTWEDPHIQIKNKPIIRKNIIIARAQVDL